MSALWIWMLLALQPVPPAPVTIDLASSKIESASSNLLSVRNRGAELFYVSPDHSVHMAPDATAEDIAQLFVEYVEKHEGNCR